MNERINQLRLEAGISRLRDEPKFMVAVSEEGTVIEPLDGLEKFAELIVQECLAHGKLTQSQAVVNGSEEYNAGREMGIEVFMNQIKQHFGVEE